MTEPTIATLSVELNRSARVLRRWARTHFPRASGTYARWTLTPEQAEAMRASFKTGVPVVSRPLRAQSSKVSRTRPEVFTPVRVALRMRAQADRMLEALNVTRDGTDLVGQLAEVIVERLTGGSRTRGSYKGYDVLTQDGLRIQVKGRMGRSKATAKQIYVRGLDPQVDPFDELIYIQFDPDFELMLALRITVAALRPIMTYTPHTNSWRTRMGKTQVPEAEDITDVARVAYDSL